MLSEEQIKQILEPISAESPCGEMAKSLPEYEAVEEQINKLSSLYGGVIDWGDVVQDCMHLLQTETKDLLLVSYSAYGLFLQNGYAGLAAGLTLYESLLTTYWEEVFPATKRIKRRLVTFSWLLEWLDKKIQEQKIVKSDQQNAARCVELLLSITEYYKTKIGEQAPDGGLLANQIKRQLTALESIQKKQQAQTKEPSAATTSTTGLVDVTVDSDIPKAMKQVASQLIKMAHFIRANQPDDVRAYRWLRTAMWIDLMNVPLSQNTTTQVPPPPEPLSARLNGLLAAGDFKVLLQETEQQFSRTPLWLDLQRYSAQALEALGGPFAAAQAVVLEELASLLNRLPGLTHLAFVNGIPFASETTRLWIDNDVLTDQAEAKGPTYDTPWLMISKEAKVLSSQGKFNDGLKLFTDGLNSADSDRDKLFWRCQQANYCYEAGHIEETIAQLDFLLKFMSERHLQDWERELFTQLLVLSLKSYGSLVEKRPQAMRGIRDNVKQVYATLCHMNLSSALQLAEKPGLSKIVQGVFDS